MLVIAFSLILSLFAFQAVAGECDQPGGQEAIILSTYDGDTQHILMQVSPEVWRSVTTRSYGIDTPEIRRGRGVSADQVEFGKRVRDEVREWTPKDSRATVFDFGTGKFGRQLLIICPYGWDESLNRRLLMQCMAEIEGYSKADIRKIRERLFLPDDFIACYAKD